MPSTSTTTTTTTYTTKFLIQIAQKFMNFLKTSYLQYSFLIYPMNTVAHAYTYYLLQHSVTKFSYDCQNKERLFS
jgi:hypothetical protein